MTKIILVLSLLFTFSAESKTAVKQSAKAKERVVASVPPTEYYLNTAQMSVGLTINSSSGDEMVVSFEGASKNGQASATCEAKNVKLRNQDGIYVSEDGNLLMQQLGTTYSYMVMTKYAFSGNCGNGGYLYGIYYPFKK